jgi:hypothetical protein
MTYFEAVSEAAKFLQDKLGPLTPKVGVVLGLGL